MQALARPGSRQKATSEEGLSSAARGAWLRGGLPCLAAARHLGQARSLSAAMSVLLGSQADGGSGELSGAPATVLHSRGKGAGRAAGADDRGPAQRV